ncbi:hypothetical protein I1A62_13540 [Rhodococcus sp. USK10]|uniref:hypothetical protein n=1 Tax=Rhodococcus sp. USK10 TaxID=2789739 RepID=UPI001C5EC540|nr:hypothetical protein [Rhodococcus sp. USK10]QYB05403.1 hypothetical protein I1A62_13540 [Rhodococcus sp. USK10]
MSLYSVNQVADRLGVTADAVIDAAGLTLGELEHAAEQHGFCATNYRDVSVLTEHEVDVITARLDRP